MNAKLLIALMLALTCRADEYLKPHFEKIVGGKADTENKFPYQVVIKQKLDKSLMCGGVIISEKHILTAAHCLYSESRMKIKAQTMIAVAGYTNIQKTENKQEVDIRSYCVHPGYSPYDTAYRHDIALVKLSTAFTFTKFVNKIGISTETVLTTNDCSVSGWGATSNTNDYPDTLQFVSLQVVPAYSCKRQYKELFNSNFQVCVRQDDGDRDFCSGDSGGPLVCGGSLVALVSFNNNVCADRKWSSVFTKVLPYSDWITEAGILNYCPASSPALITPCRLWMATLMVAVILTSNSG